MNWDAVAAIGEISGALGVIASLVYLSVQIRKSDETARAQSLQSILDGHRDRSLVPMYTNPEFAELLAKGLTDLDLLSDNQKRQFHSYVTEIVFQMQQVMQLHDRGLVPKVDFDAWMSFTGGIIKSPGGAAIWSHMQPTITPTIRGLINDYIADNTEVPSFIEIMPLFKHSGESS